MSFYSDFYSDSDDDDDDSWPARPSPPGPVQSRPFTYGKGGLDVGGVKRESVSNLKLLFRKNASRARVRAATKPWVTAQLQLYGIPFAKSANAAGLKQTLETAVKTGKVRRSQDSQIRLAMCVGLGTHS